MKRLRLLLFFPVFLSINCHKNDPTRAPAKPADYCKCFVNGKYWEAGCTDMFNNCIRAELDTPKNAFILECSNNSSQVITIDLIDTSGFNYNAGSFILTGVEINYYSHYGNSASYRDYNKSYSYSYYTDSGHVGVITASFDLINKRVSGTFSFKAKYNDGNNNSSDTINVTNGRFSLACKIDE
jgi:hypothetical protein